MTQPVASDSQVSTLQPLPARLPSGLWKPGHSGNPAGRPPGVKNAVHLVSEITHNGKDIIQVAYDLMYHAKHEATRLSAAEMLADRLWGKSMQAVELSGPGGGPLQVMDGTGLDGLTTEELRVIVAQREVLIQQRERLLMLIEAQGGPVAAISEAASPPGITESETHRGDERLSS